VLVEVTQVYHAVFMYLCHRTPL